MVVAFVYNKMLAERKEIYEKYKDDEAMLKIQKLPALATYIKEFDWLKEVDSLALANAQMNLDKVYDNFFRDPSLGYPKFKSKKANKDSYTTNNQKGTIYIEDGCIKLPKIKSLIKIKQHRRFAGLIKSCTISKAASGKFFISILVEEEKIERLAKTDKKLGVDLGIATFTCLFRWSNDRRS